MLQGTPHLPLKIIEKFGTELGIAETAFGTLQRYANDLNALIAKIRRLEKKGK